MWRRPWMRVLIVAAGLVLLGVVQIVLGTQLDDDTATARESSAPTVRADGSLAVDPPPLTLADVDEAGPGTPEEAVLRLWYWGQWGSASGVAGAYVPRVVSAVGADAIAGAYGQRRAALLSMRPEPEGAEVTPEGTVVNVVGRRRNTTPERYSFTLERLDGRWLVSYDSLLEGGLAAYVQTLATEDPNAGRVEPAAARAGVRAVQKYRAAALDVTRAAERPRARP